LFSSQFSLQCLLIAISLVPFLQAGLMHQPADASVNLHTQSASPTSISLPHKGHRSVNFPRLVIVALVQHHPLDGDDFVVFEPLLVNLGIRVPIYFDDAGPQFFGDLATNRYFVQCLLAHGVSSVMGFALC
jgi:hypothetical protein